MPATGLSGREHAVSTLAPHLSPKQRRDFCLVLVVPTIGVAGLGGLVERWAMGSEAIPIPAPPILTEGLQGSHGASGASVSSSIKWGRSRYPLWGITINNNCRKKFQTRDSAAWLV